MMNYTIEFRDIDIPDYERVIEVTCEEAQLHAFIAIHQTIVGNALGGVRAFAYTRSEDALTDALRLAKGMTYKAILSGIETGGGKSVIILPPGFSSPTEPMLRAFGQAVHALQGKYIAAEDLGVGLDSIAMIREETPYVCGIDSVSGDPSIFTAHGVFLCIQEAARLLWGAHSLKGRTVAIQGLGAVGGKLAKALFFAGADLLVSDPRDDLVEAACRLYAAQAVPVEGILSSSCDILAPCAFGGVIHSGNIQQLRCKAIVGAANNQLECPALGRDLLEQGIFYAPDYLANAGGLINVASAVFGQYDPKQVLSRVERLPLILKEVYEKGQMTGEDMVSVSDHLVEERLEAAASLV